MRVTPFLVFATTVTTPSTATFCPTYFEASQADIVGGSARDRDGSHTVNKKANTGRRRNSLISLYPQCKNTALTWLKARVSGQESFDPALAVSGALGISGCFWRTNNQVCVLPSLKWTRQLATSWVRFCKPVSTTVLPVPIFQATRCVCLSTCPEMGDFSPLKTFW